MMHEKKVRSGTCLREIFKWRNYIKKKVFMICYIRCMKKETYLRCQMEITKKRRNKIRSFREIILVKKLENKYLEGHF